MTPIVPVLLCGGSGTRLWPLSRSLYPKQFMDIGGRTLLGDTLRRVAALPGPLGEPLVLCNEEQRFFAASIMQQHGMRGSILLEPEPRNTAPALAAAALFATAGGDDPLLLVLPSDHAVTPDSLFAEAVAAARTCAEDGRLVAFGVTPTRPETGFGYIRTGAPLGPGFGVDRFLEKPSLHAAQDMLDQGGHLWNSGMFLFRASVYIRELERLAPSIHAAVAAACRLRKPDLDFVRLDAEAFRNSPSDSIDYAVMEHTSLAAVVPLAAAWNDLGSWSAFYETGARDDRDNVTVGDVLTENTSGCYLHSSGRLLATVAVRDLTVVETPDAVLVMDRRHAQGLKKLVAQLQEQGRAEKDTHLRVYRPWGSYEVLAQGLFFQVKRIVVEPGSGLSLQMHHHRAEHWVVVNGTARIVVGENRSLIHEDQSTYIPQGTPHRLENPGKIPLVIIEIQTGSYLGEDDIIRLKDHYGRATPPETPADGRNGKRSPGKISRADDATRKRSRT